MLEARALTKWFGGLKVVSDVSFTVRAGEVLGYLGPNGSGKTTTVNMVTGLLPPTSGEVCFDGRPIETDAVAFRRHVGCVPEEPHLYPYLSGREHLALVAGLRQMDRVTADRRIDGLLDLFGLATYADTSMSSYSKGMRQKVLIAAALLADPPLLVFDEPLSGLDATSVLVFRHLLLELAARGKAVLYSSHSLDTVERVCSRVLVLHQGRVVAHDEVGRLRDVLQQASLEAVFQQLVCDVDPAVTARDLVSAMTIGAA
jgi:ABC-2 type transport system ATP-binding protein